MLVGAHAPAHHGYPRAAGDLGIWILPDEENARGAAAEKNHRHTEKIINAAPHIRFVRRCVTDPPLYPGCMKGTGGSDMINDIGEHVDIIPERAELLLWGYRIGDLAAAGGSKYSRPVFAAMIRGLDAISRSKSIGTRERRFTVWAGDFNNLFWMGVPERLASQAERVIARYMEEVPGFEAKECGATPGVPLIPVLCYQHGTIGEYRGDDFAGRTYVDRDEYGTGRVIQMRSWYPEGFLEMLRHRI